MLYANWYHFYNLKDMKNIHGGVLLLVKLQASACNYTKIKTPPWVFFMFFKLQIIPNHKLQTVTNAFLLHKHNRV